MKQLQDLYRKLEQERQRLAKIIAATGLKSEEALKQSKVIDELLNQIHKLENN